MVPGQSIPDLAPQKRVDTFGEYVSNNPAAKEFENNMRHIKGPEQNMFVEVRSEEAIYDHVETTLNLKLCNQYLTRYAIQHGMALPDFPIVTKAQIQDGLAEPDYEAGERPCVYGRECTGFKMAVACKAENPERYAAVEAWIPKEFYFGIKGDKIREAMANGTPLSDVQNPEPIMCVLCQLSIVTHFYKKFDLGLTQDPPHILHSFQVQANVPGEYPLEKMLMGNKEFAGIAAPYLRFVPDNYAWEPNPPVTVIEIDPYTREKHRVSRPSIQRWLERPCMDFH